LRTSEDAGDPADSISYGLNAAQEVSGANLHRSIGRLIKTRREELGLSRRELGQRADISHSVISRIETGCAPSLRTLERIGHALDMTLLVRFEAGPSAE
jgi:ribosome-binding protein aMBF1 (putative translation factor)